MPAEEDGASMEVSKPVKALMKNQRRLRGVVSSVSPDGRCYVHSEYGVFPFERKSVKENKNHPNRPPHVGDTCEFRLTHQMPPSAVSVRIQVPKALDPETMKACYSLLDESCGGMSVLIFQLDAAELRHSLCCLTLCNQALDVMAEYVREDVPHFPSLLADPDAHAQVRDRIMHALPTPCARSLHTHLPSVYQLLTCLPPKFSAAIVEQASQRSARIAQCSASTPETLEEYGAYCAAVGGSKYVSFSHVFAAHLSSDIDHSGADALGTLIYKAHNLRTPVCSSTTALTFPREVWCAHADNLSLVPASRGALDCLHAMAVDALRDVPPALAYLFALGECDLQCFRFVAIPFLLAFATLCAVWGSDACLTRGVSIGRTAARSIMKMRTLVDAAEAVSAALGRLRGAASPTHPHHTALLTEILAVERVLHESTAASQPVE